MKFHWKMGCGRSKAMSKHDTNGQEHEQYLKSTDQKIKKDSEESYHSHGHHHHRKKDSPGTQTPLSLDKVTDYESLSNQTVFSMNSLNQRINTALGSGESGVRQETWSLQDNAQNRKEFNSSPRKEDKPGTPIRTAFKDKAPNSGPLHYNTVNKSQDRRNISNSQLEFFRLLDEKIEQGYDYGSDTES